jgi:asparagine synthase (glutamine-hydrolysing)
LFTLKQIEKKISTESLAQIFTFWTTLTPHTPFENIFELSPGHFMTVKNGEVKIQQYWSLEFPSAPNTHHNNLNRSVEEFTELIKDATSIRLRADVPVAAYLSGGLDSSVTTSLINEINPGNLKTFSIGFKDKEFDETAYQQEAANYFNTKHTAFECTASEIADAFATTIWHTEFPLLRTSPTPMYLLSKKVRENNIKVVITGEGADEVLAGYNIYKEAKIRRFWANQPNSSFRPKLLSKLYPYIPMIKGSNNLALKMFFGYKLAETADPLYSHLLRWHNTSRIKTYFSDDITESLNSYNPVDKVYGQLPENFETWSGLAKSQYLESVIFMSGYLLSSQGDRVAMANSVEGRYPFLDYRVIEFCAGLPDSFKLNCLNEKFVLKKMSQGRIPESITKRPKQAYRAPIASSFFYSGAPEYIADILSEYNLKAFGLFNPEKVNSLITKIKTNQNISEMDQMAIAGILSTQLLQKMFIEESMPTDIESLQNFKIIKE